jgi:hypothetical protein
VNLRELCLAGVHLKDLTLMNNPTVTKTIVDGMFQDQPSIEKIICMECPKIVSETGRVLFKRNLNGDGFDITMADFKVF